MHALRPGDRVPGVWVMRVPPPRRGNLVRWLLPAPPENTQLHITFNYIILNGTVLHCSASYAKDARLSTFK